jgi:hypothetical protein|tara:strand:+ start:802 stop:1725 length:924 start_codon:yes stop_codon:yes gene_type:complete
MNSTYPYRLKRFKNVKDTWGLDSMHDLILYYNPTDKELSDLRFSIMLYISKAFYFDFTLDETEFIKRLDFNRHIRDNVTPNGAVVPKREYQLEYNMILRSWSKIVNNMIINDKSLLKKFRMTPNIRIKFGTELEENIGRELDTSWPHSDAWVEGPWGMNCYTPVLGDVDNNNLNFWTPKDSDNFNDNVLNTASTYEEMQWVLDEYELDNSLKPIKGKVHISDYALIHATNREKNCGTRVSIDTTVLVGEHDVHEDREVEYLNDVKIIGENIFISTNRSILDDQVVDNATTFSHYTTGAISTHHIDKE